MKNKSHYFLLWLFLATLITFSACEKAVLIEPVDDVTLAVQKTLTSAKCTHSSDMFTKTNMLTKKPWVFCAVSHQSTEIQQVLAAILADLKFTFFEEGSYHMVIPSMNRDEFGTWEFMDNQTQILLNKGTESERFVRLLDLNDQNLVYKYDAPGLVQWELQLVSYHDKKH